MFATQQAQMFANAQQRLKGRLIAPHQHQGVEWMLSREVTPDHAKGGILADEMGLGKTIETIATTLGNMNGQTLIIVPKSLQLQWVEHIQTFTSLKVQLWKSGQEISPDASYVVTTYGNTFSGRLQSVQWYRIVLDEAHRLKNQQCKAYKCIKDIPRTVTWCLTGTPIVRSKSDVWSLLNLIGETNRNLSIDEIRQTYILRRTFDDLSAICPRLKLPEMKIHYHDVSLTDAEKRAYNDIVRYGQFTMRVADSMLLEGGDRREISNHILEVIVRLQQIVVSPSLCLETVRETGSRIFGTDVVDASEARYTECPICMEEMTDPCKTRCNHWFCANCITAACGCKMSCPMCRADIQPGGISRTTVPESIVAQDTYVSTKYQKVLDIVDETPEKIIIFTHWKKEQRDLERELTRMGRYTSIINGTTTMEQRHAIIHDFTHSERPIVLIANIQTTSTGLNLQAAKAVIFPGLDWSPSLELQAIARVHRIGVQHPVDVHRICAPGTIDDRVQHRQLTKLEFASELLNDKRIEGRLNTDQSYREFLRSVFTCI